MASPYDEFAADEAARAAIEAKNAERQAELQSRLEEMKAAPEARRV